MNSTQGASRCCHKENGLYEPQRQADVPARCMLPAPGGIRVSSVATECCRAGESSDSHALAFFKESEVFLNIGQAAKQRADNSERSRAQIDLCSVTQTVIEVSCRS